MLKLVDALVAAGEVVRLPPYEVGVLEIVMVLLSLVDEMPG